jgi:hypothetical protein
MWLWCLIAFFLGFTRELDLHKAFGSTGENVVIALMGSMGAVVMVLTFWHFRYIITALKEGNVLITIFFMGIIYMGAGFLFDGSVLGKRLVFEFITMGFAKLCEETFETIGAVLACLAVIPFALKKNAVSTDP